MLVLLAVIAMTISDILVAGQYTRSEDINAYDYYDDLLDSSTTTEPQTDAPTTTTRTTTTAATRRTTSRPSTVVYYTKANRFANSNKYQTTETSGSSNYPRTRPPTQVHPRTTTPSPAGVNRNVVDLERSENRKDYAQSRIADETEDEKYLSRRYARFLFNQRSG